MPFLVLRGTGLHELEVTDTTDRNILKDQIWYTTVI